MAHKYENKQAALLAKVKGKTGKISDKTHEEHMKLYTGYVNKTNALLEAWEKLTIKPDVMVLDGQGTAHERRLGIATHFGLVTDVPSIGSAKSRLYGKYAEPANTVFTQSPMYDKGELIGMAMRSKKNCNPIYVSPGHRITLEQSVAVIKNCIRGYRIPETTRQAHLLVNRIRIADGDKPTDMQYNLFD